MSRPWRLGAVERQAVRVLEHLADTSRQFVEDLDGLGVERDDLYAFLNDLERRHLVELQPRRIMNLAQAYPGARLTGQGASYVEDVRSRRTDAVARARAARCELLMWLYDAGAAMPVTTRLLDQDPPSLFYGEAFTEKDVINAGRYLLDAGLIHGPTAWGSQGAPIRTALTPDGVRCVEDFDADPAQMRRPQSPDSPTYMQVNYQPSGPVAQGNHAQAVATNGPSAADIAAIRDLLTAAVQAVADAEDRDELQTHVDDFITAVDAEQVDVEQVKRRANMLNRAAGRVGDVALTTATSEGTRRAIEWFTNLM